MVEVREVAGEVYDLNLPAQVIIPEATKEMNEALIVFGDVDGQENQTSINRVLSKEDTDSYNHSYPYSDIVARNLAEMLYACKMQEYERLFGGGRHLEANQYILSSGYKGDKVNDDKDGSLHLLVWTYSKIETIKAEE